MEIRYTSIIKYTDDGLCLTIAFCPTEIYLAQRLKPQPSVFAAGRVSHGAERALYGWFYSTAITIFNIRVRVYSIAGRVGTTERLWMVFKVFPFVIIAVNGYLRRHANKEREKRNQDVNRNASHRVIIQKKPRSLERGCLSKVALSLMPLGKT